jgi:pimeloyl-ACP methyl ester carboxylesterase
VLAFAAFALQMLYVLLPVLSVAVFFTRRIKRLRRLAIGGWVSGSVLGLMIVGTYMLAMNAWASPSQIIKAFYFGISLLLLLRLMDALVKWLLSLVLKVRQSRMRSWRRTAAGVLRVMIFAPLALSWVMASAMVYRPRIVPAETPGTVLAASFDTVQFQARDGQQVGGWFIQAAQPSSTTVILVHGLAGNKAGSWPLLQGFGDAGINVLAIDLRAHGQSDGQLTTFGLSEAEDVLGAIDWLKGDRPEAAQRIFTAGASIGGAAALRAAAQDPRVDGVIVLGSFDSMAVLTHDIAKAHFAPPMSMLVKYLVVPIASLHVGVDLNRFRPADDIASLWPRPVLVVHGTGDEIIPFDRGRWLFDAASPPRSSMWVNGSHNSILDDIEVIRRVIQFVQDAVPEPVI